MNKAFIFPGQGSQVVGMGKDFFESDKIAKSCMEEVNDALGYKLSDIIFNGTMEVLSVTTNTQPAIMAVSVAILRVLCARSGGKIKELCKYVAGHSLGEYSALCSSGVLSLSDTAKLLKVRAYSMQTASPVGEGGMAACIGIDTQSLQKIIDEVIDDGVCELANDNVEGQIVISGHSNNIDRMVAVLKDTGYKAIRLNVSAPFHSSLIKSAEKPMQEALSNTKFLEPIVPIISNYTADIEVKTDQIKENLVSQICGTVKWRQTMDKFHQLGITELVEIGPGKVLSNLAKKSGIDFKVSSISNIEELNTYIDSAK